MNLYRHFEYKQKNCNIIQISIVPLPPSINTWLVRKFFAENFVGNKEKKIYIVKPALDPNGWLVPAPKTLSLQSSHGRRVPCLPILTLLWASRIQYTFFQIS